MNDKTIRSTHKATYESKLDLIKKYPHATLNKFDFTPNKTKKGEVGSVDVYFKSDNGLVDIKSAVIKNNKNMWGWLHNNPGFAHVEPISKDSNFPRIWSSGGTEQKIQTKKHYKREVHGKFDFSKHTYLEDNNVIGYDIWNFKVFVDQKNWFRSKFKPIKIMVKERSVADSWDDTSTYYQMIFATYIASYLTGISREHLEFKDDVHPVITSLMRYTLYYTISVVMTRLETEPMSDLNNEYGADEIYKNMSLIPREKHYLVQSNPEFKTTHTVHEWMMVINNKPPVDEHYKLFILKISDGFTEFGLKTLNNAIASFCYSILGSQARIRSSIVNKSGIPLQCQDVFRQIVQDTIVNHDVATSVGNMRKAISDCNQTVNLAVSPATFLLPSDMKILKERIPGYSNVLFTAGEKGMVFGVNKDLNYQKEKPPPKKTHQDDTPSNHLDDLNDNKVYEKPRENNPDIPKRSGSSDKRSGGDSFHSGSSSINGYGKNHFYRNQTKPKTQRSLVTMLLTTLTVGVLASRVLRES